MQEAHFGFYGNRLVFSQRLLPNRSLAVSGGGGDPHITVWQPHVPGTHAV